MAERSTMLCLLGAPAISRNGVMEPLTLRPKEMALLGKLALAGARRGRAEIAMQLFGEADDPRGALRWHLSSVRSKLPAELRAGIEADRDSVGAHVTTDVARFRKQAQEMLAGSVQARDAGALALYRGDLLSGLTVSASPSFDTWLYVEQEELRRVFRRAVVVFARWAMSSRDGADPRPALVKLIEVDPYFEEAHVLLIQAHEASDAPSAARAAYDVYQKIVRRELHAEPRPELAQRFEGAVRSGHPLPREELIPLDEITMHVVEWPGAEPTVLAVHGSAGSAYSFTALAERLAPDVRFVAMDLRGHGFSDKPPAGYDLNSHVRDIASLIGALELRHPIVLGFSLGGAVAAAVASRCGARGLILLEAAIGDRAFLEGQVPEALVPTSETLELTFTDFDEYLQRWRAENPPYSEEAESWLDRFARYELAPLPGGRYRRRGLREALYGEWQSVLESDSLSILGRARCPVLFVRAMQPWIGGRPWFTDEIVAAQLDACPRAELFVAPESNHASLIRDPKPDLIEAIKRFIQMQRRAPTAASARG